MQDRTPQLIQFCQIMSQGKDKQIQGYRVSSKVIGQGAFGAVYLGSNAEGKEVAVKVISRESSCSGGISHIQNEILGLKACANEHVLKFLDVKKTANSYYIFLEYCSDGSLQNYIRSKRRLSEEESLRLFCEIIRGFKTIVGKNFIHRDLKTGNILMKDGKIKIADFGLCRLACKNNMAVTFAGSPMNMAPEILKGAKYDNRVDVYSIGTVLYEMLFGCSPFSGKDNQSLLQSIKSQRFNQFDSKLISNQTLDLLIKLLKPNPDERITWAELFKFESKMNKKMDAQLINHYSGLLSRISPRNICAIPSLFCLLNSQNKENKGVKGKKENPEGGSEDGTCFIDLNLCSNLFMNLMKSTKIQE